MCSLEWTCFWSRPPLAWNAVARRTKPSAAAASVATPAVVPSLARLRATTEAQSSSSRFVRHARAPAAAVTSLPAPNCSVTSTMPVSFVAPTVAALLTPAKNEEHILFLLRSLMIYHTIKDGESGSKDGE